MADQNKNIRIRAVLDTQGFDNQISQLQQKLKQIQGQSEGLSKAQGAMGGDTLMGKYAASAFGDFSKDTKKELEGIYQSQRREAMHQNISLRSKQQELDKLSKIEGQITESQRQRIGYLKDEISLLKERNRETIQQAGRTKEAIGDLGRPEENLPPSSRGAGAAMGVFKDILKSIGLGTIIQGGLNAATHMIERDRKILGTQAQGANVASQEMRDEWQGRGARGIFYAKERQNAMRMASEEQDGQGAIDFARIAGNTAMGAGAGAIFGGPAGALAGGVAGFAGSMSNDRLRSRIFDQEQYRSLLTAEGMQKYQGNLQAQKALDPRRTMAQEYFEQNSGNIQQNQRSMGFTTDQELYGSTPEQSAITSQILEASYAPTAKPIMEWKRQGRGAGWQEVGSAYPSTGTSPLQPQYGGLTSDSVLSDILGQDQSGPLDLNRRSEGYMLDQMKNGFGTAQFTEANIMRQRQSILQGGGATDSQNLAGTAAEYERNLNMMNAGDVFGKISGAGMGTQTSQTEDSVKRLLAEGVKLGVDTSSMPQEMQRFTQATASIMTQGGGISNTAASRFSNNLTGTSAIDIQSGMGAYQEALGRAKNSGGMEGQIGYGFLMGDEAKKTLGDKGFSKLGKSSEMMNAINQLSAEDLERIPGLAKGLASRLGVDEEQLQELVSQKDFTKQSRTSKLEGLQKQFSKATEGMGVDEKQAYMQGDEGSELISRLFTATGQERGGALQGGASSMMAKMLSGSAFAGGANQLGDQLGKVDGDLATSPDTAAIAAEKSQAQGDASRIKALRDNLDELKNAAKSHSESAELYNKQFQLFIDAAKDGGDALGQMKGQLDQLIDSLAERGFVAAKPSEG